MVAILSLVAICGVAIMGGIISYNSSSNETELFRSNVEALSDGGDVNDWWYWDDKCQCYLPQKQKSPQF
ncbi:MAG: hypothetical protein SNG27_05820 [Rikenellaceae bacterium]